MSDGASSARQAARPSSATWVVRRGAQRELRGLRIMRDRGRASTSGGCVERHACGVAVLGQPGNVNGSSDVDAHVPTVAAGYAHTRKSYRVAFRHPEGRRTLPRRRFLMDATESAAEMIAEDAVRLARKKGVTSPDLVEFHVDHETGDVTEAMVRKYILEKWSEDFEAE